jgi:hypothetical protein
MGEPRVLHIVHFNDVYNIEAASREPVGGAAKFVSKVRHALLQQDAQQAADAVGWQHKQHVNHNTS